MIKLNNGLIILLQGDCLHEMKRIKPNSIDLVFADLPYGSTSLHWDKQILLTQLQPLMLNVSKQRSSWLLFASDMFTAKLMVAMEQYYIQKYIWRKNKPHGIMQSNTQPMKYYEEIIHFSSNRQYTYNPIKALRYGKGKNCYRYEHYAGESSHNTLEKQPKFYDPDYVLPGNVLDFPTVPNRSGRLHATQKPLALVEYLIKTYTNENDIVLDPTFGSCTTGVACLNLNRKFIGIEKDPIEFAKGRKRLEGILHGDIDCI